MLHRITIGLFTGFLCILFIQAAFGPFEHGTAGEPIADGESCIGEPIVVDYAYDYRMLEPHACKPQCADGKQRYILYANNVATQCDTPPGCNDWGEDRKVTCMPPTVSAVSS